MSPPFALRQYRALTRLLAPLLPLVLSRRARTGKEDAARVHERLGRPHARRPDGTLIWLHGASVGESLVLASLIDALADRRPELNFLVTTGTVTSAALMAKRLPAAARHQYVPVDTPGAVTGFLDHWAPDLAVFAESELWPNLIAQTAGRGTPMALINARMNDASLQRWRRRHAMARWLLSRFAWIGAADARTRDGLEDLTGEPVTLAGNLKLETGPAPADPDELAALTAHLAGRPVWLAASTHEGEDETVLHAHQALLKSHPGALLLLAPRHPDRGAALAALARRHGLDPAIRSLGQLPAPDQPVWIADTLGEMGLWFSLAPAAFIGGSLRAGIGGHNPVEASHAGAAVISGPHVASFEDLYAAYHRHGAVLDAGDALTLSAAVERIWQGDGPKPDAAARALAQASGGALELTVTTLLDLLGPRPEGEIQ